MRDSTWKEDTRCIGCGECIDHCPTAALSILGSTFDPRQGPGRKQAAQRPAARCRADENTYGLTGSGWQRIRPDYCISRRKSFLRFQQGDQTWKSI
ncbi:MAG TPA: 4Fe-4S dicluster domain-containing protein [Desulfobulbus sp.]|nr:4Fe-4S dicluster domain-containing protein [Desulfobulbus sp.]